MSASRSRFVEARTRTSRATGCSPPSRSSSPSSSTRSSLAWVPAARSPISSSSRVPPCARSNLPRRRATAPVKAPFSWPKSSLSSSSPGIAAQLTFTKGRARRAEPACSARATSSLPVPFSPVTSTRASLAALLATVSRSRRITGLSPRISPVAPRAARRPAFSSRRRCRSSALAMDTSSRPGCSGFSMKSSAPRRTASSAVWMVPWPLIMMTGGWSPASASSASRARPSASGSWTSSSSSSTGSAASRARAPATSGAPVTA